MSGELEMTKEGIEGEIGYKGERGYSAYEVAVKNGYEGTEQEWIDHFGLDLTNYLKGNDVVDSLDSTYTTKPLSANMGKQLNDNITNLNNTVSSVRESNFFKSTEQLNLNANFSEKNGIVTIKLSVEVQPETTGGLIFFKIDNLPDHLKISREVALNEIYTICNGCYFVGGDKVNFEFVKNGIEEGYDYLIRGYSELLERDDPHTIVVTASYIVD